MLFRSEFEFSNWDKDIDDVRGDLKVNPIYDAKPRMLRVNFLNVNGEVVFTDHVMYGEYVSVPDYIPISSPGLNKVYIFDYWQGIEDAIIKNNTNLLPVFMELDRYYNVTFLNDDGSIFKVIENVEYGTASELPEGTPNKKKTDTEQFEFVGWEDNYLQVKENIEVKPIFNNIPKIGRAHV